MPIGSKIRGNALRTLESRLAFGFAGGLKSPEALPDPEGMAGTLAKIRKDHDSPAFEADKRTIAAAISYLRRNGKPDGWRGLKHACIGVCSPDRGGGGFPQPTPSFSQSSWGSPTPKLRRGADSNACRCS